MWKFYFHMFGVSGYVTVIDISLNSIVVSEQYDFNISKFIETCFITIIWSILLKYMYTSKECVFLLFLPTLSYEYQVKVIGSAVQFNSRFILFYFALWVFLT